MTSLQPAVISLDRTALIRMRDPGNIMYHLLYFFSLTSSALSPLSTTEHYILTFVLYFCFRHSTSPLSLMPRRSILVAVAAAWACGAANLLPASPPQPSILYTLGPCRP